MNHHRSKTKGLSKNKHVTINLHTCSKRKQSDQQRLRQLLLNQPTIDHSIRFSPLGALYQNSSLSLLQVEAGQHYSKIAWKSLAFMQCPKLYQRPLSLPQTRTRHARGAFTNPILEQEFLFEQKQQRTLKLYFHIQDVLERESNKTLELVDSICVKGIIPCDLETCFMTDLAKNLSSKPTQKSLSLLQNGLNRLIDIFLKP